MNASKYQTAIYEHLSNRLGSQAVKAVAGSGKTTTAIEAIGYIDRTYTVLLSAFNVDIREEFKKRSDAKGYKHVKCVNYNGFGWGICLRNLLIAPELDIDKTDNILEFVTIPGHKKLYAYKPTVRRIVSLFKNLRTKNPEAEYEDVVDHYNIDTPEDDDFKGIVLRCFQDCIGHHSHYDFDDQKFMPLHLGMPIPKYDNVFIDEFQDTSPLEMDLMLAAGDTITALGDPDQAIYGFKGATPAAFEEFARRTNATELPLSICYRCPTSVIDEAKKIVPRIEAAPGAALGLVEDLDHRILHSRLKAGDFVLCRVTEDLVKHCLIDIKEGRLARVRGRDFGGALEYILDKVSGNRCIPIDEFITRLVDYKIQRIEQLIALRRQNQILALEDRINTILALADGASNSEEIRVLGRRIFNESKTFSGIDYMTIHKAKGLQAKDVFLLRPDLLPHPLSKERAWMSAEENRLKYVAITRAEHSLYYVRGK